MSTTWIIIIVVIAFGVLICFLLAIANFAYDRFLQRYQELDKVPLQGDLSIYDFINYINHNEFDGKLQFIQISQLAGDAYSKGKLFLSTNTLNKNSLASITIIAHELGHAKQDKEGGKLKRLHFLRGFGKIIGVFLPLLIISGIVMLILGEDYFNISFILLGCGAGIFVLSLFTKLLTISIEKDASKKAIKMLEEYLSEDELKKAKRFLKDARLTYWADFLRLILGWTALSKKSSLF